MHLENSRLTQCSVLILVLVEDGLRVRVKYSDEYEHYYVLILVLVEDGLRAWQLDYKFQGEEGLNPCSCGGWSQRRQQ